jgi:hypothetical protein
MDLSTRPAFLETWQWGADKTPEGQFFSVAPESMRTALKYIDALEIELARERELREDDKKQWGKLYNALLEPKAKPVATNAGEETSSDAQ